jgi:hypothetical protein
MSEEGGTREARPPAFDPADVAPTGPRGATRDSAPHPGASSPPRAGGSPHAMLSLQATAGNAAVASLLERGASSAPRTTTVQRQGPATVDNVAELDKLLDAWLTPHRRILDQLGRLNTTEKATIVAGYRDRLARKLSFAEMREAVVTLGLTLPVKLDWLEKTAFLTSGIAYREIQSYVTAAPQSERDMLKNDRWRSFFVSVCDNATIITAVADLKFDLVTQLTWLRSEASARFSLRYGQVQPLITAASQADRDRLKVPEWKSWFLALCDNRTIFTAMSDLGFDLPTKVEWIRGEASALFSLDYTKMSPLLAGAPPAELAIVGGDAYRSFWTDVCTNATMALLVDVLFPTNLARKIEWMGAEGTNLALIRGKLAGASPAEKLAVYDSGVVRALMLSLCTTAEYLQFAFDLGGGWPRWLEWAGAKGFTVLSLADATVDLGQFPAGGAVAEFLRVVHSPGTVDAVHTHVRGLSDPDLAALNATPMTMDVLNVVFGAAKDPIVRDLAGEISREDRRITNTETLLSGPTSGPFTSGTFGGDQRYTITYQRNALVVDVGIALTPAAGDATAASLLPSAIATWSANISGAWNGKFRITNGQRTIPIQFRPNLGSSGANAVTVHSGVWVWPALNASNWFVPDPAVPSQMAAVSTAPIHEFGHLIGNLDEYMIGAAHYLTVVGRTPVGDPNAAAETDTAGTTRYANTVSVMGQGSTILQRHVEKLLTWVNANLRPGEPPFTFAP